MDVTSIMGTKPSPEVIEEMLVGKSPAEVAALVWTLWARKFERMRRNAGAGRSMPLGQGKFRTARESCLTQLSRA
jgi:hypothetical protein